MRSPNGYFLARNAPLGWLLYAYQCACFVITIYEFQICICSLFWALRSGHYWFWRCQIAYWPPAAAAIANYGNCSINVAPLSRAHSSCPSDANAVTRNVWIFVGPNGIYWQQPLFAVLLIVLIMDLIICGESKNKNLKKNKNKSTEKYNNNNEK